MTKNHPQDSLRIKNALLLLALGKVGNAYDWEELGSLRLGVGRLPRWIMNLSAAGVTVKGGAIGFFDIVLPCLALHCVALHQIT